MRPKSPEDGVVLKGTSPPDNDHDDGNGCSSGRVDHLSARILLTALEAQYGGGSSCMTTSTCTVTSSKCTSSDSSWTTASRKNSPSKEVVRRPQHERTGLGLSALPKSSLGKRTKSWQLVSDAGSSNVGAAVRKEDIRKKAALSLGARRRSEDVADDYDGSVSSNNESDSEHEDDVDSFARPRLARKVLGNDSTIKVPFTSADNKLEEDSGDDSSDIDSFSSENEESACDRRRNQSCHWDGSLSSDDEKVTPNLLKPKSAPVGLAAAAAVARRSVPRAISRRHQAVDGNMLPEQTIANGIAILERSVKSKLAAKGASSIKEPRKYQEQAKAIPRGVGSNLKPSSLPCALPASAMGPQKFPVQMHQTAGVPVRPAFLQQRLFGCQQQQPPHAHSMRPRTKPPAAKAHIYNLGVDILVQCLSYLEPGEVLTTLTYPLSKTWREVYCKQGQLWKVLCLAEPFHAKLGSSIAGSDEDEENLSLTTSTTASEMRSVFGQYRLLYTSFVRCITYVNKIQKEAMRLHKDRPQIEAPHLESSNREGFSALPESSVSSSDSSSSGSLSQIMSAPRMRASLRQQDLPASFGNFLAEAREVVRQEAHRNFEGGTLHLDSGAESPQSSLSASCLSSSCAETSDDDCSWTDTESLRILSGAVAASASRSVEPTAQKRPAATLAPARAASPASKKRRLDTVSTSIASAGNVGASESLASASKRSAIIRKSPPGPRFAPSGITAGVLGTKKEGKSREPGHVDLPWSCAVYAVINWMVAFADVLGIQVTCLKALPSLLEDERQRSTAQLAGLTGIVVRAMVAFKDSVELHTAAFHTLVLLARPIGGKEGMLFHRTMVGEGANGHGQALNGVAGAGLGQAQPQPRGIFEMGSSGQATSTGNGTAVIIDSMRRFASNEGLQAMSCWSMVNIALIPSQKSMLVRLGGIGVTVQAMMMHPMSAEVQFRALFALINLVIPCEQTSANEGGRVSRSSVEKEMLDECVGKIAYLVVVAMKNFCTTKAILNRACLVLHNLSLNREYHSTLLWTPSCYEMIQWTMTNYPNDRVIEQSASGTLQRLQQTLRVDDDLRQKFCSWLSRPPHAAKPALLC